MNNFAKFLIGWIVWSIGTVVYAQFATNAVLPLTGEISAVEFAYGAMMASYFIGAPIITGIWMFGMAE